MDASISIDNIREASTRIDPVFRDTPQLACEPISERLGVEAMLKLEFVNPIQASSRGWSTRRTRSSSPWATARSSTASVPG